MTIKTWMTSLAVCVMTLTASAVAHATVIDTTPSWDGLSAFGLFGEPNAASVGQTITISDANTILQSFSFRVKDQTNRDPIDFAAYVMAWDDTNKVATGSVLYQSAKQTTSLGDTFETFNFNTGGLNLTQGNQYILLLSASDFFDTLDGSGYIGDTNGDNYAGGTAYFLENGNDFSQVTTSSWIAPGSTDLAFTANFTSAPTPEPASIAMLAMGAVAMGLTTRRRRQQ